MEYSWITYEEPGVMADKGNMRGIFSTYTYRTKWHDQVRSLQDVFRENIWPNVLKFDGKLSGGKVDYDCNGCGSMNDVRDYMIELRAVGGYDIPRITS